MKNLTDIKNEVAFEKENCKWNCLFMVDQWNYSDEVAKRYAQSVAEDLRKRIIQEAFDDPYDIRRYANSIRNVEIITP